MLVIPRVSRRSRRLRSTCTFPVMRFRRESLESNGQVCPVKGERQVSEEGTAEEVKPRKRQLDDGDYTQTLLNSLTLEQIREAVFRLSPDKKIQVRTHADSLEALRSTASSTEKIQMVLLDVERTYPFKHCLLLRLLSGEATDYATANRQYRSADFEFRLAHVSREPVLSLTFEHIVEFTEWVEVEKDTRKKRTVRTRQPIVVRIQSDRQLVTLNYPGYTHSSLSSIGSGTYESVVEALLAVLKSDFSLKLKTLPIKDTLGFFLEGPNRRVLRVKADVDSPLARLDMSAKGESTNIEEALASFISAHLKDVDLTALTEAAKKAFNGAVLNSIVLFWLQESLFTRLRFWDIGTELFFVWNKENPSYRTVDTIAQVLADTSHNDTATHLSVSPMAWISQLKPLSLITPAELALSYELSPGDARKILIRALNAGLVEPIYRISSTGTLIEFQNDWSADLQKFKRNLTTVDGRHIDGGNPENIEVAFRRIIASGKGGN